ncbi:unnamed protein product [Soboliphyme baturini]|uniref:2-(3-amino-3-carboxypropyl)histidine synthase subunit 1 n=1 Tax=Soboliphyme baturini TaxID=241478 RepID=A0A183IIA3_9BILA|nr:unnamed protein product [Soboliphyme baturini]
MRQCSVGRIPDELLNNEALNAAIAVLPSNYNFEIHKTVWQVLNRKCRTVGLQFPEGLLLYSCMIADIIEKFTDAETIIFAEVTYGACCIDDFTAGAMGCDLLVHYGHSCLIPVQETSEVPVLYVFVEMRFDTVHLIETLRSNFSNYPHLALCSTVQFISSLQVLRIIVLWVFQAVKQALASAEQKITIPQCRPLSAGEVLGCTSPKLPADISGVVFVGDGRFHIESVMIANPTFPIFKYDPYSKECTREYYDNERMLDVRKTSINQAAACQTFGLILGTLGRQGSPAIFDVRKFRLLQCFIEIGVNILFESLLHRVISLLAKVIHTLWIHVSCPRLSIDWGAQFEKPLLNPYEASVMLGVMEWQSVYPMNYYSADGPWNNRAVNSLRVKAASQKQHVRVEFERLPPQQATNDATH